MTLKISATAFCVDWVRVAEMTHAARRKVPTGVLERQSFNEVQVVNSDVGLTKKW
jgi:hypothetical protein